MKRILAIFLVLSLLLPCFALADEEAKEDRATAQVYCEATPSRCVTFTYPAQYDFHANRSFGFFNVYYDDYQYAAVWLMDTSLERLHFFESNYVTNPSSNNKHAPLYYLTDQMCAAGIFGDERGLPCGAFDMLEIGITLDNGYFIIVQSNCFSRQITGCYDLLLDVLGNFVDTDVVADWLEKTWYPQVLSQGEA